MDLGFIIDSSANFNNYYKLEKDFITRVGTFFSLGRYTTRTSVMAHSNTVNLASKFSDFHDEEQFKQLVDGIPFVGSTASIDKALVAANEEMFSIKSGGRVGVKQVLVIITDGVSDTYATDAFKIAQKIQKQNIHIVVVAVGKEAQRDSLKLLGNQVIYVDNYQELASIDLSSKVANFIAQEGK